MHFAFSWTFSILHQTPLPRIPVCLLTHATLVKHLLNKQIIANHCTSISVKPHLLYTLSPHQLVILTGGTDPSLQTASYSIHKTCRCLSITLPLQIQNIHLYNNVGILGCQSLNKIAIVVFKIKVQVTLCICQCFVSMPSTS